MFHYLHCFRLTVSGCCLRFANNFSLKVLLKICLFFSQFQPVLLIKVLLIKKKRVNGPGWDWRIGWSSTIWLPVNLQVTIFIKNHPIGRIQQNAEFLSLINRSLHQCPLTSDISLKALGTSLIKSVYLTYEDNSTVAGWVHFPPKL